MRITCNGTARIQHAETGQIYSIYASELEWEEQVDINERGMGPEGLHEAVVYHDQLGTLRWMIWEYPTGAESQLEYDIGNHNMIENLEYGLSDVLDTDDKLANDIEYLEEWFLERYEDPAHNSSLYVDRNPRLFSGRYNARNVLLEDFDSEFEKSTIDAAVQKIESKGTVIWKRKWKAVFEDPRTFLHDGPELDGSDLPPMPSRQRVRDALINKKTELREFYEALLIEINVCHLQIEGDNWLAINEPEKRAELLKFLDDITILAKEIPDLTPDQDKQPTEKQIEKAQTWTYRYLETLKQQSDAFFAPETIARVSFPIGVILICGGIGALLGGLTLGGLGIFGGASMGTLVGKFITGELKAGSMVQKSIQAMEKEASVQKEESEDPTP
jgi:hypothetical protein